MNPEAWLYVTGSLVARFDGQVANDWLEAGRRLLPEGFPIRLETESQAAERTWAWNEAEVGRSIALLSKGLIGRVALVSELESTEIGCFNADGYFDGSGWPAVFGMRARHDERTVGAWYELFAAFASRLDDATGWMEIGPWDSWVETPEEHDAGLGPFYGLRGHGRFLRGAHWADVLTADHLEKIGGIEAVSAVSGQIDRLPGGRVLSVATENFRSAPSQVTQARIDAFSAALSPVFSGRVDGLYE